MNIDFRHGDLFDVLPTLPDNSVDSCVTDPPYELNFMGRAWDRTGVAFKPETWAQVFRVLKPGGHLLAFGGTRTFHRITCAIEDAGFDIRDCLSWLYGSGFPKSLNLPGGIGTALKPAWEPIILARKPLIGTVAANVLAHGTGGLNIDASRIRTEGADRATYEQNCSGDRGHEDNRTRDLEFGMGCGKASDVGRWPANVLLDEEAGKVLDAQAPVTGAAAPVTGDEPSVASRGNVTGKRARVAGAFHADKGGASRFFYCAKPSRRERDMGCEHLAHKTAGECTDREDGSAGLNNPRAGAGRTGGGRNDHPTVKPLTLMRYLVKLVTPQGGSCLDPFTGSGTTGMACCYEGVDFVGVEREEAFMDIAWSRIMAASLDAEEAA